MVPNVNSKVALIESMNTQFQYETEETLAAELDKEYHQVHVQCTIIYYTIAASTNWGIVISEDIL